jgi:transposase, IS30 family
MYLRSDSAAGVRFLSAVQEGCGLKPSARAAGVGKATGYRWLREAFLALRDSGCSVEDAQAELGYFSALALVWDQQRLTAPGRRRHHLAVDQATEDEFWRSFLGGDTLEAARRSAGIGRATAYRWWQQRFGQMREQGQSARAAEHRLRVPPARVRAWEAGRRRVSERAHRQREATDRRAVRQSARHAELLLRARAALGRRGPRHAVLAIDALRDDEHRGLQDPRA